MKCIRNTYKSQQNKIFLDLPFGSLLHTARSNDTKNKRKRMKKKSKFWYYNAQQYAIRIRMEDPKLFCFDGMCIAKKKIFFLTLCSSVFFHILLLISIFPDVDVLTKSVRRLFKSKSCKFNKIRDTDCCFICL